MRWLLAGAGMAAAIWVARTWWRRDTRRVSDSWVAERERAEQRNTFVGPSWRWPVRKQINEAGRFNAERLRKRA